MCKLKQLKTEKVLSVITLTRFERVDTKFSFLRKILKIVQYPDQFVSPATVHLRLLAATMERRQQHRRETLMEHTRKYFHNFVY